MTPATPWFAIAKHLCTKAPFLSDLSTDDEDNVLVAPGVRCNFARWKEIAGIIIVEEEHRSIVIDSGLHSIGVIVNVH